MLDQDRTIVPFVAARQNLDAFRAKHVDRVTDALKFRNPRLGAKDARDYAVMTLTDIFRHASDEVANTMWQHKAPRWLFRTGVTLLSVFAAAKLADFEVSQLRAIGAGGLFAALTGGVWNTAMRGRLNGYWYQFMNGDAMARVVNPEAVDTPKTYARAEHIVHDHLYYRPLTVAGPHPHPPRNDAA